MGASSLGWAVRGGLSTTAAWPGIRDTHRSPVSAQYLVSTPTVQTPDLLRESPSWERGSLHGALSDPLRGRKTRLPRTGRAQAAGACPGGSPAEARRAPSSNPHTHAVRPQCLGELVPTNTQSRRAHASSRQAPCCPHRHPHPHHGPETEQEHSRLHCRIPNAPMPLPAIILPAHLLFHTWRIWLARLTCAREFTAQACRRKHAFPGM